MQVVPQRTTATLLPIIGAHVAPGTIIHTDEWRSYRQVTSLPNVAAHGTVKHTITFVDPVTGVHTQHVESYWNRVKAKLKRMQGCHTEHIPSYLDEFMWMERYGLTSPQAWINILQHI